MLPEGKEGYDKETAMKHKHAPDMKGITVTPLATVDLGAEIDGTDGRELRMRLVTFEPGGVFGSVHDDQSIGIASDLLHESTLTHGDRCRL